MEKPADELHQSSNGNANSSSSKSEATKPTELSSKRESSWPSVLFYIHLNILGLYGIIILFTQTKLITIVFSKLTILFFCSFR